jgi:hypothetical protein
MSAAILTWPRPALFPIVLLWLSVSASVSHAQSNNYTVDIRPVLNGLDIELGHVAKANALVVNLTNKSPTRVRCNVNFNAPPQTPLRTTRHIDPGRTEASVLRAHRRWFRVTVDVACVPAQTTGR